MKLLSLGEFSIQSEDPQYSPGVCVLNILTKSGFTFQCYMDERDNTLKPHYLTLNDEVLEVGNYLMMRYSKIKQSDFRYGKVGLNDDSFSVEPTKIINSKKFLSYLQSEYRDETLKKIIK